MPTATFESLAVRHTLAQYPEPSASANADSGFISEAGLERLAQAAATAFDQEWSGWPALDEPDRPCPFN